MGEKKNKHIYCMCDHINAYIKKCIIRYISKYIFAYVFQYTKSGIYIYIYFTINIFKYKMYYYLQYNQKRLEL